VGLAGKARMYPLKLTYIDQKRIELARALASELRILLLDERLAGLNPSEYASAWSSFAACRLKDALSFWLST
jgi:ABC-type branched-subunit amino acid transport system ATPase component